MLKKLTESQLTLPHNVKTEEIKKKKTVVARISERESVMSNLNS